MATFLSLGARVAISRLAWKACLSSCAVLLMAAGAGGIRELAEVRGKGAVPDPVRMKVGWSCNSSKGISTIVPWLTYRCIFVQDQVSNPESTHGCFPQRQQACIQPCIAH